MRVYWRCAHACTKYGVADAHTESVTRESGAHEKNYLWRYSHATPKHILA